MRSGRSRRAATSAAPYWKLNGLSAAVQREAGRKDFKRRERCVGFTEAGTGW